MKTITICGSMSFKETILEYEKILKSKGFNVKLPEECIKGIKKEIASRKHFDRIISSDNDAILVINNKKNDIENYIGPNTFAEIAFAFHFNKKIYLLNDIYQPYQDELLGWNVIPLNNNLDKLKEV